MIATSPEIEAYLVQFEQLAERRESAEPAWLASFRKNAIERFAEIGFPTTRYEEWKYTSVRPIEETRFRPASRTTDLTAADIESRFGPAGVRLVFVNGHYAPELSTAETLPKGVTADSLASVLSADPGAVEPYLARIARYQDHAFVALNTALMQDGAFVHIRRGAVVEEPIHLLFLTEFVSGDDPVATRPRTLIVADELSQATVVETYAGTNGQVYFTNAVTEIFVAESAVFDHYKVQQESEAAYHIATQQLEQARASVFSSHNISLGGALVRNDVNARLGGEGIESTLNGLYIVNGRQHVDNHTAIDHAMPHCNSHELYKGIMDGKATGVFNGKIFVRQDAQKTDAKQTNQNLLISEDAVIDTKPQLEIFADDVRCTHGATVGQLDLDALFYLRARGIGVNEARNLLIHAFAGDILDRIKVEPLRERLNAALVEKLGK